MSWPAAVSLIPPSCNTGGKVLIDWFRITFAEGWLQLLREFLCIAFDRSVVFSEAKGLFGFALGEAVIVDGVAVGRLCWAGSSMRGRAMLDLSGHACKVVRNWDVFVQFLEIDRAEARITRCDLAVDFLDGEVTVDEALKAYEAGRFCSSGRPPQARHLSDLGSGEGSTLYVGSRQSSKLLRVYEKGKQLGDRVSNWVRAELELKGADYVISPAVLICPEQFFAGAYDVLADWMSCARRKLEVVRRAAEIEIGHALQVAQQQVGSVVAFVAHKLGWPASRIVFHLIGLHPSSRIVGHCLHVDDVRLRHLELLDEADVCVA